MTVATNNYQIGQSAVPSQNFHLTTPAVPDGTLQLYRGNVGSPIGSAIVSVNAQDIPKWSKLPMFSVGRNVDQGGGAQNTLVPILFNIEALDSHNWYDTSNGRFTPQVAGWYQFEWNAVIFSTGGGALVDASTRVLKNGVEALRGSQAIVAAAAGTQYYGSSGAGRLFLNGTTDYVQVSVYATSSVAGTITVIGEATNSFTRFSGQLAQAT